MFKILDWLKLKNKKNIYIKPQKFTSMKRANSNVEFIHEGHPLYDNTVSKEENKTFLLAPNETAYNETSLIHNFVAIVTHNDLTYLVINSFKHFKEQSIGGLLQYDENIYDVIPFYEDETEYQTAHDFKFREVYEYDHPVESYALITEHLSLVSKLTIEHGKKPLTVSMIDDQRQLFMEKLPQEQIELIDYIIIPAVDAYNAIQEKHKAKIS